tara:strand:+ start:320 stop:808 length:489 start_codon:yes stop_codon:yes gene_type:complete
MEALDIIGYPNYEIFSDGRILSFKRYKEGKFIKHRLGTNGYYYVGLRKNGNQKFLNIHRLLMQHFKPDEYDENLQVDHKNRIRTDNSLENLKMVTHQQNGQNQGISKNNKSGHSNIFWDKKNKNWRFEKTINTLRYTKSFKTIEQAIEFKNVFCVIHNVENN